MYIPSTVSLTSTAFSRTLALQSGDDTIGIIPIIVGLIVVVIEIAGMWKVFTKAGEPGWACIIPIYNIVVLLKVARRPIWWIILLIIPLVGVIVSIIVCIDIAKNFGKGAGFGIGLALLGVIFYPILGFGSAEYNPQG
ncbi:MAG TPA: DUF5684 domain-containing protein [Blastocatellia bacterium]|nr:DUF5684 domain-containing protein [Blastocatellia bacterium]